ncbi:MAG: helix-turn-helix domain-containing protein [Pseudomonadales bacterium]|nr:helix-turn-helix domain-containing protein [Pseudomonadales bacterium]
MHRSTLATLAQAMQAFLIDKGLDATEIFNRAGLDHTKIFDVDARFPIYGMNRLWTIASQESGSEAIVYEVIPRLELHMLHAMGHAWLASQNLKEALERFVRYHRMLSTNMDVRMEAGEGRWSLVGRAIDTAGRHETESALAMCLQVCRKCYGEDLKPTLVQLMLPDPDSTGLVEKFYGCAVEYGHAINVFHFQATDLERRLVSANAYVAFAMEEVISNYLSRFDSEDVVSRVRRSVAKMLVHREPTKQELAMELNIAPRTLQRRLEEQGSSIKEIVDDTRHQLALDYLAMGHYSVKEIAFSLGFSDPSNFSRAFKRWEGITPKAYRKQA